MLLSIAMMHGMMHGSGVHDSWLTAWPLMALWLLLMLTFWSLLITGLVLGIRWLWHETARRPPAAVEVLKMRYAKGELSREEFEAMRQTLEPS